MSALSSLLEEIPKDRTRLLDNLGRIRREIGPVTPELSDALADAMNLRRGDVHEVASFYSYLRVPLEARRVCTGPVCDCLGAAADGAVPVPCLGHCDLAPVAMEGELVVGAVVHRTNGFLLEPDELRAPPELPPEQVVALLKDSGLTGMGGAAFPAWRKWEAVRAEPAPRVVIVNADEGEPGTFKDRYVMELRPQLLLEGVEAAMRFCETEEAYVYLREEYATARTRLREAIVARGLPVEIVVGAGSYVCGEETAMLESMEGRRGMPRLRPPFPAQAGYLAAPPSSTTSRPSPTSRASCAASGRRAGCGRSRAPSASRAASRRRSTSPRGSSSTTTPGARPTRSARSCPEGRRAGSFRRRRSTSPSQPTPSPSGARRRARRGCRSSPPPIRCGGCWRRRCASSPRSRARSARPAGSGRARSTTTSPAGSTSPRRRRTSG